MNITSHGRLPLAPLLHSYVTGGLPDAAELGRLPGLGARFAAVLGATARFLYPHFVDRASDADLADALVRFYQASVQPPLHEAALRRRLGIVRHGLAYLLRGLDPLPAKVEACVQPGGAYHVPGLGPVFWSALVQGLRPARHPGWTPAVLTGVQRLGLARWAPGDGPAVVYASLLQAYARIQVAEPSLTALPIDHFLTLVAAVEGRNLHRPTSEPDPDPVTAAVRQTRARRPLRERLKERGQALAQAQHELEAGLAQGDGKLLGTALAAADPEGSARSTLDWGRHAEALALWVGRLWESPEPYVTLAAFWEADPLPGAGLWLPAAVLHLRDPQAYYPWADEVRQGYAVLDDSTAFTGSTAESYWLFNEGVLWLRARHQLHPLEVPAVLAALAPEEERPLRRGPASLVDGRPTFGGFCADTFHFLAELAHNNGREWMERQRERYRFAVRQPLVELCRALAARYVEPVLRGEHGYHLDTAARSGRALTSICKNAFGRSGPYNTVLWIAFCQHPRGGPRTEVQFFVRLDAEGLRYGLRVGRKAKPALERLRRNLEMHGEAIRRALAEEGALSGCRFGSADGAGAPCEIEDVVDLRRWAAGRSLEAARVLSPDAALLESDDLVGDVQLTFDRLLTLFAAATDEDVGAFLCRRLGEAATGATYTAGDFRRQTFLGDDWLRRARDLLDLKRQMILQGVPGTGKTHVARCLARLLTGGREEAVRLVQFHPAYSYEEFVEGIKVRSVAVDGRHDVTYPVEDGLLCAFAAEAERRPAEPHVLVIDEINRGNLPRIFGELLYLLEYRGQAVGLPYSRRGFRLPANLYLLGTMNAADRSVALIDQALRRRFSFLEMPPDANVLAGWLAAHVPPQGRAFADRVLGLFERLNARLRNDLGPQGQIGHSFFMVHDLDDARLRMVWQHHVRPLLEEHFVGQPGRASQYDLEQLLDADPRRGARRRASHVPR
jgi:uncharacterized protein (DUF2461 family)